MPVLPADPPVTAKPVPVLTIDGPSGSGKGTISRHVAEALGWHLLDSGALYRAVGYAASMEGLDLSDAEAVTRCAGDVRITFRAAKDGGLLSTLDSQIIRHQAAISAVTGALAVLGVGAIVLGLSRVSPLLKIFWPF